MTAVGATSSSTGTSVYSTPASSSSTQTMDGNMFLQLLVTQLKNQDPSSPMDSGQMITQTSQLASMEQLTALNTTSTDSYTAQMRSEAANVIGKTVSWTDSNGVAQSGVASSVSFSGTTPTVTVGSSTVDLTSLTGIAQAPAASSTTGSTTTGTTSS